MDSQIKHLEAKLAVTERRLEQTQELLDRTLSKAMADRDDHQRLADAFQLVMDGLEVRDTVDVDISYNLQQMIREITSIDTELDAALDLDALTANLQAVVDRLDLVTAHIERPKINVFNISEVMN